MAAIAAHLNLPVIPAVLLCIAASLIVAGNMIFYTVLGEVNGKRAPQEQIGMLFVNIRFFEVVRLHKGLFPSSRKRVVMNILVVLSFALILIGFFFW